MYIVVDQLWSKTLGTYQEGIIYDCKKSNLLVTYFYPLHMSI